MTRHWRSGPGSGQCFHPMTPSSGVTLGFYHNETYLQRIRNILVGSWEVFNLAYPHIRLHIFTAQFEHLVFHFIAHLAHSKDPAAYLHSRIDCADEHIGSLLFTMPFSGLFFMRRVLTTLFLSCYELLIPITWYRKRLNWNNDSMICFAARCVPGRNFSFSHLLRRCLGEWLKVKHYTMRFIKMSKRVKGYNSF